jgi:NitT/TauT family transport system substrate-binding protein
MHALVEGAAVLTRRRLLREATALGALAVGAPLIAACSPAAAPAAPATSEPKATALPPPETTVLRLGGIPTCDCALWIFDDMLRDEGFTELKTVTTGGALLRGEADFGSVYANSLVTGVDAGFPLVTVAGEHVGCIELWAAPGISSIRDLRGKKYEVFDRTVTLGDRKAAGLFYGLLLSILAHIGMDPAEMNLVDVPEDRDVTTDYLDAKADVVFLPVHQGPLMRRNPKRRGAVILDSTNDKPWSQNYCCMLTANRDWAKANPVATKRATRAFLRAADVVAKDKKAAVQVAIDKGIYKANKALTPEILFETIEMLSYDWREVDPEETLRFFALRLRDVKLLKRSPQQILDEGADFAYFRQMRKELKA